MTTVTQKPAEAPKKPVEAKKPEAAPKTNKADKFLEAAMTFKGQPYKWGGGHGGTMNGPGPVDCSGLVQQAGRMAGVNLDGTAALQQKKGQPVGMDQLKPGDLLFRGSPARHVGIYIGNGMALHAPKTGDVVRTVPANTFESARRVFDGAGSAVDAPETGAAPAPAPKATSGSLVKGPTRPSTPPDTRIGGTGGEKSRMDLPDAPAPVKLPQGDGGTAGHGDLLAKLANYGITPEQLKELAEKYGVPLELLLAVIQQESGGDANAKSPAGAQGLMQLMPATARGLGVENPLNPLQNLEGGAKYLGQMLDQFDGDPKLALAAYNAGPGNVKKHGGVPPFAETQEYVEKILGSLQAA